MADQPILRVRKVSYAYDEGKTPVLHDNNVEIWPGEIVILTGQSGSGKTTLLTLMGALRRLQEGEIDVGAKTLTADSTSDEMVEVRRGIGFIFQAHNLFRSLTAIQNVRMGLELMKDLSREEIERDAREVLKRLGLRSDKPEDDRTYSKPDALSGGQKQRVAIARAIAHKPQLILADEPTAALDEKSGRDVLKLFHELKDKGCTVVIVTHDPRIVKTADRFVGMEYGRIRWNMTGEEVHETTEFLKKCKAFSEMLEGQVTTTGTLADIAVRLHRRKYAPGEVIVWQGEKGDELFLIKKGKVKVLGSETDPVRDGASRDRLPDLSGTKELATLGEYDIFGELALQDPNSRRAATGVAVTEVELYALGKKDFEAAQEASDPFGQAVKNITDRRRSGPLPLREEKSRK